MFALKLDLSELEHLKMELNNTNVMYFESFFNKELFGGFVQKVQTLEAKNFFIKIKIRKEKENKDLILGEGIVVITGLKTEGQKNNHGFCQILNKYLENQQVLKIEQINLEKILLFEFPDCKLWVELFSKNNIILTDKNNKIIGCLHNEEWKTRKIKRNEIYNLPPSNSGNIIDYVAKSAHLDEKKNLVSNIIKNVNVSPLLVEEILKNAKIEKNDVNFANYKEVISELKKSYGKTLLNSVKYVLRNNSFQLFNIDIPFFETIKQNTNKILDDLIIKKEIFSAQNIILEDQNKTKNNLLRILNEQTMALVKLEKRAKEYKEKGDYIYKNYVLIESITEDVKKKAKIKSLKELEKQVNEKTGFLNPVSRIDPKNSKITLTL